jgi:hypothetical protein
MEQLQPDPLVNMTIDKLDKLRKELWYYADQLDNLICPTWANSCLLLVKMGELDELIEEHELPGAWFSAHARVNNAVVMVTAPEIWQVSLRYFILLGLTR